MNGIVSTTLYPEVIKNIFLSKYELGEERRRSSVSVVSGPTSNIDTAQTRVCRTPVTIQYCHTESAESSGRDGYDDHPLDIQIRSSLAKYFLQQLEDSNSLAIHLDSST